MEFQLLYDGKGPGATASTISYTFTIQKGDLIPTDSEISAMYNFAEFMKPFVQMTKAIGGGKWVTISSVRPLINKITHVFLQLSEGDTAMVREMKQLMLAKMNEYNGEGCNMEVRIKQGYVTRSPV